MLILIINNSKVITTATFHIEGCSCHTVTTMNTFYLCLYVVHSLINVLLQQIITVNIPPKEQQENKHEPFGGWLFGPQMGRESPRCDKNHIYKQT